MMFELNADGKEMVYSPPGFRRNVLLFLTLFFVALVAGIWFLVDEHRNNPFSPESDNYPLFAIVIIGVIGLVWIGIFVQVKRNFYRMVVDGNEGAITIYWQHLIRESIQKIEFRSVSSFLTAVAPVSRYSYGWELRIRFRNGSEIPVVKFYKESVAVAALSAANNVIETSRAIATQDNR